LTQYLKTQSGRTLAYVKTEGISPGIVFLGGFKSDMQGTKALDLEKWARANGRAFLRFDYSGHGQSSQSFTDGCIGDWAEDAKVALTSLTEGRQVLVGSSMGGWISLILALKIPEKLAAIVGIATAADFTEDSMWAGLSPEQRTEMATTGQVALPSEYGEPYIITSRLIEDGRQHLVLRKPLNLPFPTRFLQGTADEDVDISVALHILDHATGDDIRLNLVKNADHRFSTPECLTLIQSSVDEVIERAAG